MLRVSNSSSLLGGVELACASSEARSREQAGVRDAVVGTTRRCGIAWEGGSSGEGGDAGWRSRCPSRRLRSGVDVGGNEDGLVATVVEGVVGVAGGVGAIGGGVVYRAILGIEGIPTRIVHGLIITSSSLPANMWTRPTARLQLRCRLPFHGGCCGCRSSGYEINTRRPQDLSAWGACR